jgi:hypothetical protein
MAFVVQKGERYEIRESRLTERGPRATTLATFRVLSDEVMRKAAARSTSPSFPAAAVRARAIELGAPVAAPAAHTAAQTLLGELSRGQRLAPAVEALLRSELGDPGPKVRGTLPELVRWIGATDEDRGLALGDLLELTDALPVPKKAQRG